MHGAIVMNGKIIKHAIYVAIAGLLAAALLFKLDAFALDQIIKPYQSVRSGGMGGVRLTTGLYDENFFGNPARIMANPAWRVGMPDPMLESTTATLSSISELVGDDDILTGISDNAGTNLHGRIQTTFPSFYIPAEESINMQFAFALIMSTQFDVDLRRNYSVSPQAITDLGPAFTVGRSWMDGALETGITAHATYRLASRDGYSFVDLLQGASLSPLDSGGEGAHIDFDVGATYKIPELRPLDFDLTVAFAVNNILGGGYDNLHLSIADTGLLPPSQPRTFGFGIAARKESLWEFTDFVLALEFTDIGSNGSSGLERDVGSAGGSIFRTMHIGTEAHWGLLAPRLGLNQGYLAAGLGIDLKLLNIDVATYGEEMSLNTGGLQDRRIALRLGFQI